MVAVVLWQMLISTTISQNPDGYGRGMARHTDVWMYYYMQKAVIMPVCPRIRLHDACNHVRCTSAGCFRPMAEEARSV